MVDKVVIVAEQRDSRPLRLTLELAAAARRFAATVDAVTWGGAPGPAAEELGRYGVGRLWSVGDLGASVAGPSVAAALAEHWSSGDRPDAILIGSTYNGRDVAARLSVRLDLPVITNVVGLELDGDSLVSAHSVFGGSGTVTARFTGPGPGIFVVRSKSFEATENGGPPAEVVDLPVPDLGASDGAQVFNRYVDARSGPSLDEAAIVVSGGRGMGSAEKFQLIEDLAIVLHAAPGASRAVVDLGWVPYSYQVGQTGKIVKPEVYLAFGISGAMQHRVGMKDSQRIVAVDKNPSAPIFGIADLGVVGDAQEILPRLIVALKARSSTSKG
jgi:electron transfer flavoprotein alpha subunit